MRGQVAVALPPADACRETSTITGKITAISTDLIPDEMFAVCAGYAKKSAQDSGRRFAQGPHGRQRVAASVSALPLLSVAS
jgi:hypothetical protein